MLLLLQRIARFPAAVMAVLVCIFVMSAPIDLCCTHTETAHCEETCTEQAAHQDECCTASAHTEQTESSDTRTGADETGHGADCNSCCLCAASILSGENYAAALLIPVPVSRLYQDTPAACIAGDAPPVPPPNHS